MLSLFTPKKEIDQCISKTNEIYFTEDRSISQSVLINTIIFLSKKENAKKSLYYVPFLFKLFLYFSNYILVNTNVEQALISACKIYGVRYEKHRELYSQKTDFQALKEFPFIENILARNSLYVQFKNGVSYELGYLRYVVMYLLKIHLDIRNRIDKKDSNIDIQKSYINECLFYARLVNFYSINVQKISRSGGEKTSIELTTIQMFVKHLSVWKTSDKTRYFEIDDPIDFKTLTSNHLQAKIDTLSNNEFNFADVLVPLYDRIKDEYQNEKEDFFLYRIYKHHKQINVRLYSFEPDLKQNAFWNDKIVNKLKIKNGLELSYKNKSITKFQLGPELKHNTHLFLFMVLYIELDIDVPDPFIRYMRKVDFLGERDYVSIVFFYNFFANALIPYGCDFGLQKNDIVSKVAKHEKAIKRIYDCNSPDRYRTIYDVIALPEQDKTKNQSVKKTSAKIKKHTRTKLTQAQRMALKMKV